MNVIETKPAGIDSFVKAAADAEREGMETARARYAVIIQRVDKSEPGDAAEIGKIAVTLKLTQEDIKADARAAAELLDLRKQAAEMKAALPKLAAKAKAPACRGIDDFDEKRHIVAIAIRKLSQLNWMIRDLQRKNPRICNGKVDPVEPSEGPTATAGLVRVRLLKRTGRGGTNASGFGHGYDYGTVSVTEAEAAVMFAAGEAEEVPFATCADGKPEPKVRFKWLREIADRFGVKQPAGTAAFVDAETAEKEITAGRAEAFPIPTVG